MNRRERTASLSEVVVAPNGQPREWKLAAYIVRRGWLHLVLLTGVFIFVFPFAWMIATSMKTDDELTNQRWMPAIPTFRSHSPYVLARPELSKPIGVSAEIGRASCRERG